MKNYLSKHIACSNGAYRKFSGNKKPLIVFISRQNAVNGFY